MFFSKCSKFIRLGSPVRINLLLELVVLFKKVFQVRMKYFEFTARRSVVYTENIVCQSLFSISIFDDWISGVYSKVILSFEKKLWSSEVIKNVLVRINIVIQENIFKRKWVKFALCILYLRIFIRKTCWIYLWQFMLKELKSERKQEKTNLKKYTSTPLVALHPSLTIKFL